jgi:nicotinamidase-related amidase
MAVTTLDPVTALIVVDLQKGIVGLPTAHPAADIIAQTVRLLAAFRARKLPVVLVNVSAGAPGRTEAPRFDTSALPASWTDLIPELEQQKGDILVTKRSWGAFANTDLAQQLKALGVTQIVVTGVATSIGVEATARQAYELGFNVTLASDAMTDLRPDAHAHSLAQIFPRLGETGTVEDILALLPARG